MTSVAAENADGRFHGAPGRRKGVAVPGQAAPVMPWLNGIDPSTPALTTRPLARTVDTPSRFGEERWDLSPAQFEAHAQPISINWLLGGDTFRDQLKTYGWVLLNYQPDDTDSAVGYARPALLTVGVAVARTRVFAEFVAQRGRSTFSQVTADDLDAYLDYLANSSWTIARKSDYASEVRRLWAHRLLLPTWMRLPDAHPWHGLGWQDLFGEGRPAREETKTERIPEHRVKLLLAWAIRVIDDLSSDIITTAHEYNRLAQRGNERFRATSPNPSGARIRQIESYISRLQEQGGALPGRCALGEQPVVDFRHIGRVLDCHGDSLNRPTIHRMLESSGLPIASCAALELRPSGGIDGQPWHPDPVDYYEAPDLARVLTGAALVVTAYLSGMRPGELLNLRRGCVDHDKATDMWTLRGLVFKDQRDERGAKLAEGVEREVPWVVVEPVARAIQAMEALHDRDEVFPLNLTYSNRTSNGRSALSTTRAVEYIMTFADWVNSYCERTGRPDAIPAESGTGTLALRRFRKTLCWHIYRRPRGLVAAAIQYGHVATTMTLGYAGNAASGFPDDLAFERFLARLDDLVDAQQRLESGEHISGPAANVYRQRVDEAAHRFQGIVLASGRQARGLLSNDAMQVFEGRGMTCVPQLGKQLCRERTQQGVETTPDLSDCREGCQCKVRTDGNVIQLRTKAAVLRDVVDDPLAPPLRVERERHELARLDAVVAQHEASRPTEEADGDR